MRYGANLLFEYGFEAQRESRPLCEKRIVVIEVRTPKEALRRATSYGRAEQLFYRNADGVRFRVRFLGLVDLIGLSGADEIYYSMFRTSRPEKHLNRDDQLSVFRSGPKTIRSAWWAVPEWAAAPDRARKPSSSKQALERGGVEQGAVRKRPRAGRSAPSR